MPVLSPRVALFALRPAGRAEAESLYDERVVVLFLALFVSPVVSSHAGLDNQLVALARMPCDRFAQSTEGHKPQARNHFARRPFLVLARIIGTNEAEASIGRATFGDELWITSQMTDGGQCETVHSDPPRRSRLCLTG
jgi:hypothetical protein